MLTDEVPLFELNKTYINIIDNISFDYMDLETINSIFKDGRVFSHFIEPWLAKKFNLKHIKGCKDHDFTNINNSEIIYDQKIFTKGGCRYYPSNMIGSGRVFNKEKFEEKAHKLIYIIVSNINFPEIKIRTE